MIRKSKLLSLYFFIIFVYTAASSTYLTVTDWAPLYLSCLPMVLSVVVAAIYNVKLLDKKLVFLVIILVAWNVAQYYINHVSPSPYALMLVVVCWVAYNVFKEDFVERYLKLTTVLAAINLIVWIAFIISPGLFNTLGESIGLPTMPVSYSFLISNVSVKADSIRNCGFCWEPGRYSCMLILAFYFYYVKYGFNIRKKEGVILIVSLLSTLSTTGFISLGVFITYHLWKTKKANLFYWVSFVIVAVFVWNMDFMSGKFERFGYSEERFETSVAQADWVASNGGSEKVYCPQRFDGLAFQWMNIEHMNPIIGDSHNFTKFYINQHLGYFIVASEGILWIILCYGIPLGLLCYWCLFCASRQFGSKNNKSYTWLFFGLFLVMNFSYNFWEFPIFMTLWLWPYFDNKLYIKQTI